MHRPENDSEKLADLGQRIKAHEAEETAADNPGPSGASQAWRVASELFGGVVVGAGVGYGLDQWLGTTPWLFLTCFMFGVAGSGMTIYRQATRNIDPDDKG